MASFRDMKDREWTVSPKFADLKRFFLEEKLDPLVATGTPFGITLLLLFFTREQRSKLNVDETDFLSAIDPDEQIAAEASRVTVEAISVFFKARTA